MTRQVWSVGFRYRIERSRSESEPAHHVAPLGQPAAVDPGASWEFVCECERPDCNERVILSPAEFEGIKARRDLVVAPGHEESAAMRARRIAHALCDEAEALHAQAQHQIKRATQNVERRQNLRYNPDELQPNRRVSVDRFIPRARLRRTIRSVGKPDVTASSTARASSLPTVVLDAPRRCKPPARALYEIGRGIIQILGLIWDSRRLTDKPKPPIYGGFRRSG
jgi:hypothetical protein